MFNTLSNNADTIRAHCSITNPLLGLDDLFNRLDDLFNRACACATHELGELLVSFSEFADVVLPLWSVLSSCSVHVLAAASVAIDGVTRLLMRSASSVKKAFMAKQEAPLLTTV